ncbi:MAG: hypothetical protein AAF846_24165 [Chloroflexota bacterium]
MLDETKTIKAKDVVNNSDSVYGLMQPYILISDDSITGRFDNLLQALAILKDAGWDALQMSYTGTSIMVLVENTNYKSKNRG